MAISAASSDAPMAGDMVGLIDLLHPKLDEVRWEQIAIMLSRIRRYNGVGGLPCSVGQHVLIGQALMPDAVAMGVIPKSSAKYIQPYWLLHDAHETRLGELTTPVKQALLAVCPEAAAAWRGLARRHDLVLHEAAGLTISFEDPAIHGPIKALDALALAAERSHFVIPDHTTDVFAFVPSRLAIDAVVGSHHSGALVRGIACMTEDTVATRLMAAFSGSLPCFRGRR
jgi:hypothetical protein